MNWRKMTQAEFLQRARMEAGSSISAGRPPDASRLPNVERERSKPTCTREEVVVGVRKRRPVSTTTH